MDLIAARLCARIAASHYRLAGLTMPPHLRAHIEAVEAGSVSGTESGCNAEQLEYDPDPISTIEAASILGCSTRYVRRIAESLDGRNIAGRWVFDKQTVTDYAMARRAG